jgi:TFIIIC subunit triple barrel domain
VPRAGRGGYRSTWINPGLRRPKRHLEVAPTISLPKKGITASLSTPTPTPTPAPVLANPGDGENEEEDEIDDDDEVQERQEPLQDSTKAPTETTELPNSMATKKPERIQILDLHTENPIIQYKAHTFSCSWAENIGTELLFTFHDPERPLPALRSLPDDVELLAASSARLISKPVKLVPKAPVHGETDEEYEESGSKNPGFVDQKSGGITIPVGNGASNSRKDQARFLERMIEIKQQKGEKDAVTVVAQRRLYPAGWRAVLKERRAEERAELRSLVRKGESDVQEAVKRLKEMDEEDRAAEEEERLKKESGPLKKSRAGRKPKDVDGPRPAKRARGGPLFRRPRGGRARTNLFHDGGSDSPVTVGDSDNEPETLSTPTPQRWDERQ